MKSKFLHSTSKKSAIVLSYLALTLNTLTAIFLTPFILKQLGVGEYGLYQMIYSIGQYILVLDLGIATVLVRYLSEYKARKDKKGEENFAAIISRFSIVISILVVIIGLVINANIENIFTDLTSDEYTISHQMFYLMIIQFVFTILDHYYQGIISAHERFTFTRIINIIQILASFTLTFILVYVGMGAVGIVLANLIIIFIRLIIDAYYVYNILHFKIKFHYWSFSIVKPAIGLMLAILLQSVMGFTTSTIDKTILGILCTKTDVAVYSISATIVTMFNTLPIVISGLFQPQVTRMIVNNATSSKLTDLVIRVGRWQFILTGAVLFGFILFGYDFIKIWVGEEMKQAVIITLIILPFNMIPLVQTVCLSILNGYDKRLHRSLVLIVMAIINVIVSIYLVKKIGVLGAPIGTAISYFLGQGVAMNIYYYKVIKLEVSRMFKEIFSKTLPALIITTVLSYPLTYWTDINIVSFGIKVILFLAIFSVIMMKWGFNKEEKSVAMQFISRLKI